MKVCRMRQTCEICSVTQGEQTNLSKDELCCKVKIIVQLLRLIYDLSFHFKKALHRVLKLLAVGPKSNAEISLEKPQTKCLITVRREDLTLLSYACRTAIQS